MAFWNKKSKQVDEAIDSFHGKGDELSRKEKSDQKGEGWEQLSMIPGVGIQAVGSFNMFYDQYVNRAYENEFAKIMSYREMAMYPEIADVIEDGTNESTQVDHDDRVINLQILDAGLTSNENIIKNITKEFNNFFYQQLENFPETIWDFFRTYLIDGRIFYERVINENKQNEGIKSVKKLPSETMDYIYDPATGTILAYFQYLKRGGGRPKTLEDAIKRKDVIVFNPEQIGFINYGIYGKNKYDILGYLEKCKVPYNQLKLLEISVVIYRLIRSPERFVFRIDTGNMPRDKALKYVEKIKMKMAKKQTYNATTGQLTMEPEIFCIRKDTEIPLLDGRYLTLKEIIKDHNNGKENWVYSINQDTLNIEPGKIKNAAITRKNEKLIRTWFDDKNYIDTTYDHKFILRNGDECRADKLIIGQSLMPLYKKNVIMGSSNLDYEKIYNPGTKRWRWTHKMSIGDIKLDEIRHHKDYNRFNNNPINLKIMGKSDHFELHQKILKERWENDYGAQVQSIRSGVKKWYLNEDNRKRQSEWVTKTNIEQNKAEKMRAILNTPEIRKLQKEMAKKAQIKRFSNPENREYMRKIKSILFDDFLINRLCELFDQYYPIRNDLLKILSDDKIFMDHLEKINEKQSFSNIQYDHINKQTLMKMLKHMGYENYPDFRQNFVYNHKVVKIEYLKETADAGCIEVEGNHNFAVSKNSKSLIFIRNSMLENFYLPQSSDGRGSQIDTLGGDASGFAELDDLYYFARKLYRALKYPQSRVEASNQGQSGDTMFGGGSTQEIPRDEIKWAKFLERQQNKFELEMTRLFLIHLEFKGLKREYDLSTKKIRCILVPPSNYKEQMEQQFLESRYNNYQALADRAEISKYYLMKKFLRWSEDDVQENIDGLKKDAKYGFIEDAGDAGRGFSDRRLKENIQEI